MDAVEKLLDFQVPDYTRLSPDGSKVVWETKLFLGHKTGDNVVGSIWIAEVGKEKSARQLTSGLYNDETPQWAADSSSIFFQSDRKEAGKKTAIYQLHLSGGEAIPLTDTEHEKPISRFAVSPDGKHVAYLSADEDSPEKKQKKKEKDDANVFGEDWEFNRLRIVHIATKTTETLVSGDFHVTDLVWSPDSKALAYIVQSTPEFEDGFQRGSNLRLVEVATKKITEIGQLEYGAQTQYVRLGLHWANERIYIRCNAEPCPEPSSTIICSYSIDGDWRCNAGGDTYCGIDVRTCGDEIVVMVMNDLYDELRRGPDDVILRGLSNVSFYDVVQSPSDPSELIIALTKSSFNEPPEVYTLTSSARTPVQLSSHGAAFSDPASIGIEIHTRSLDKSVELDGFFVAPRSACTDGRPTKPLPTLVQPHGGPYWRLNSTFWPDLGWQHALNRSGYAVFYPNYRGGAGHGKAFATAYRMGEYDHDDVVALVQEVIQAGLADKDKLIVGGWSQGGLLSYLSAVRNGTHGLGWSYKGAIPYAGVTDGDTMAMTTDVPGMEASMISGAPWEMDMDSLASRKGSAMHTFKEAADAGRIPPMLLLHGEEDVRVPVTQAWGFHRACRSRGLPCQLVTYPRCGHAPKERNQLLDIHRRVLKFCDTHFE